MSNTALEKIKNEVAKDHEYTDFKGVFPDQQDFDHYSLIINEIAIRYASESVKEYKEKLKVKLNNLAKTTHGRVFTTEVIELIDSFDKQ